MIDPIDRSSRFLFLLFSGPQVHLIWGRFALTVTDFFYSFQKSEIRIWNQKLRQKRELQHFSILRTAGDVVPPLFYRKGRGTNNIKLILAASDG